MSERKAYIYSILIYYCNCLPDNVSHVLHLQKRIWDINKMAMGIMAILYRQKQTRELKKKAFIVVLYHPIRNVYNYWLYSPSSSPDANDVFKNIEKYRFPFREHQQFNMHSFST